MLGDHIKCNGSTLALSDDGTIPNITHNNVLPPFIGTPTSQAHQSPYNTSADQIILRYGTSENRLDILDGWLEFRKLLFLSGITKGFQWVDGSFTERNEKEPRDIDIVTFFDTQGTSQHDVMTKLATHGIDINNHKNTKQLFFCDAYWVCLNIDASQLIGQSIFWFGLFTHTRTNIWKGLLQVPLPTSHAEIEKCTTITNQLKEQCKTILS